MDRIKEMKEFLQDAEEILLQQRIDKIKLICMSEENTRREIQTIIDGMTMERTGGCIVVSCLRSSYITGSHEFGIAYYADEPFVDEEPDCVYYNLGLLFEGIEDDLQYMNKELRNKYIRIMASEKEELRRWFMDKIYMRLGVVFKPIIKDMQNKRNIDIFYGNYMGELELIGQM